MANNFCDAKNPQRACRIIIFGITGDLAARRLLPSLFHLHVQQHLPKNFECWGCSRKDWDDEKLYHYTKEAIEKFGDSSLKEALATHWESFEQRLHFHRVRFDHKEDYQSLKEKMSTLSAHDGRTFNPCENNLFYLSTPASYFTTICNELAQCGLIKKQRPPTPWSRVLIEKPFGTDLASATKLQSELLNYLDDSQIFRIDHWLGKETVQNLMVWRFSNHIFEALWNRSHIDHVQITVSEDLGMGRRGSFFEESGMLRDMLQNHMMQLLALIAMEPPLSLSPDHIFAEKVKVLEALRPIDHKEAVRGQYHSSDELAPSYRDEEGVDPHSSVETYVACKMFVDNWRWSEVPFYLRTGKRLTSRCTQIAIVFKPEPSFLFPQKPHSQRHNVLTIKIQPDEGISLTMNCKRPEMGRTTAPVTMDFDVQSTFGSKGPMAYERLLMESIDGDNTLFAHGQEVLLSWKAVDPLLKKWQEETPQFPNYPVFSSGPDAAKRLIEEDGRFWIDHSSKNCR